MTLEDESTSDNPPPRVVLKKRRKPTHAKVEMRTFQKGDDSAINGMSTWTSYYFKIENAYHKAGKPLIVVKEVEGLPSRACAYKQLATLYPNTLWTSKNEGSQDSDQTTFEAVRDPREAQKRIEKSPKCFLSWCGGTANVPEVCVIGYIWAEDSDAARRVAYRVDPQEGNWIDISTHKCDTLDNLQDLFKKDIRFETTPENGIVTQRGFLLADTIKNSVSAQKVLKRFMLLGDNGMHYLKPTHNL